MSELLVLVDTSAWIPFIRGGRHDTSDTLDQLLAARHVATNDVVNAELLIGAKDHQGYQEFESDLGAIPHLALDRKVWARVGRLGFALKRQGLSIPVPDLAIAACAMEYGCALLHADRHFELIAKHAPLKIYKPARAVSG